MIWLTWRQHRAAIVAIALVVAVLGIVFIVTGQQMADAFQQLGVGDCLAHPAHPNCGNIVGAYRDQYGVYISASGWLALLPAFLGMLVGAPLVARELEHGTHRLVWTQGISAGRWLAIKLAVLFAVTLAASVILTALMSWWHVTWSQLDGHMKPYMYDFEGIVPLAYTVFALALGIAAGALLRRVIPAMVVAFAGFLAVRLPLEFLLRPRFQPPLTYTRDILTVLAPTTTQTPLRGGWNLDEGWTDATGHHLADSTVFQACDSRVGGTKMDLFQCIHNHGWLAFTTYQPADRFWLFQGIEAAILVALAVGLLALAIWWVRKRLV
ncbi:MAG: transporter [Nitrososphaerota archaeon]